ncbi:hypothetical protein [Paenibacillus lemnae]|uniref:Flagellar protein FliT n=1 Tax=Paenibacillus lemnae TaxID=1330551 RepID=A0A848MAY9_PAELE|nr:hypothetical protein [Paenibacillus lemnae]NMO96624.1 hypothetical protein [Paenibacillus lemnae]
MDSGSMTIHELDMCISELKQETERVISGLAAMSYEELEVFVEHREQLVKQLGELAAQTPPNTEQQSQVQQILQHDAAIRARMNALCLEAQDWIRQRNQAKAQRSAYEGYGVTDSILMDRKK